MTETHLPTDPYDLSLEQIDMSDPSLYERNLMGAYFARLRKDNPVHFSEGSACGAFWSITKFNDIREVARNHDVFSADSSNGGHLLGYETWFNDDADLQLPMMIAMDRPRHDVQRKAVSPVLRGENLKKMEAGIRDSIVEILEPLSDNETFNWVERVSIPLTTRTLAVLFDFPFDEQEKLTRWSDVSLAVPGDGLVDTWEQRKKEMMEMKERFTALWKERRNNTDGFDLISMLATSLDADSMSNEEYMGNVVLLIVGGNDTTRNSLSGSVLALHQFPEEDAKLRQNPGLVTNFVSEAIRWQTPVAHMKRTALEDVSLGDKTIRRGDKVAMWYVSGNRDEEVIPRANELIVDRENARNHLSFGHGLHRCVGDRLGELQLQVAWEEILKRTRSLEVIGDPVRIRSNVLMGYSDLPVRVRRR